jgi:hypothetical protein
LVITIHCIFTGPQLCSSGHFLDNAIADMQAIMDLLNGQTCIVIPADIQQIAQQNRAAVPLAKLCDHAQLQLKVDGRMNRSD